MEALESPILTAGTPRPHSSTAGLECTYTDFEKPGPVIRYGAAVQIKKGEDLHHVEVDCKLGGHPVGVYSVFDGHNGAGAAMLTKERYLQVVTDELLQEGSRDQMLSRLPIALAQAFVTCNGEVPKDEKSGTTATVMVVHRWTLTVAAVGDSRAVLETAKAGVTELTVDHRLETHAEEVRRIELHGGHVGRLSTAEGVEVGPLRCWPGGLCVSRSIGDCDVGTHITALPHVRQVEVPPTGGRVIIATDGLWDAVDSAKAASLCRGKPAAAAATCLVKESIKARGLRDDITVLVVDLLPSTTSDSDLDAVPVPKVKSKGFLSKLKSRKSKPVIETIPSPNSILDFPSVLNDHDAFGHKEIGETVHMRGAWCSVCGRLVSSRAGEASIRAGDALCSEHGQKQQ